MNTPSKPIGASASFSRTTSLPSFASLGQAARPGAAPIYLPPGIPAPPRLPSDFVDEDEEMWDDDEIFRPGYRRPLPAQTKPDRATPAKVTAGGFVVPGTPG